MFRCSVNETIPNFVKCVAACAKIESCLLSFFSNHCNLCSEGVFNPDTASPHLIGMKNNKTTNLCRDIKTVFNYTDGDLENATTTIETTQMLTTRTPSTCPDGYKMFQRKTVQVCLGVEYDVKTFNKPRAMEMCSNIGGFISGPDSLEERDYLRDTVMEMRKSSITAFRGVGIWVDGDKKKECVGLSVECKTLSSFVFLDETMQSLGGYHFYKGQPDGILGLQNCLQLMVIKNGQNGFLDDQGCASPYGYGVVSSAIACAKIIS